MLQLGMRIGATLGVMALAANAFALNPQREVEPNDTLGSATAITIDDGDVRGQLAGAFDVDYYKFTSPGGVVRFLIGIDAACQQATTAHSLVYASIVDAGGATITTGRELTGCAGGTMNIIDGNLVAGTYYLKFEVFNPTGSPTPPVPTSDDYVITPLTKLAPTNAVVRETEPNNTAATATALALNGGEVRGQLAGSFDLDYYIFQSQGGIVRFIIGLDADCTSDIAPLTGTNIRASIRATDGTLISIKDLSACTSGTTRAAVTSLEANTQPGSYYLLFQTVPDAAPTQADYSIYPFGLFDPKKNTCTMDLDGNGTVDALTDGIMLMRALFGLTGAAVTNGAVGVGATRTTWVDIRAYLNSQCGFNFP